MKQTIKLLALSVLTAACFALIKAPAAHAATLTVASGNDETTVNSTCSLSEAITNINNGNDTTYPECTNSSTDPYGTNDTITLPAGTITLVADVPTINKDTSIQGQGMGVSVVDGGGVYSGLAVYGTGTEDFKISKVTMSETKDQGVLAANVNFTANQVEVYGGADKPGSTTSMSGGLNFGNTIGADLNVELTDVYVHDIQTFGGALNAILVSGMTTDGGVTNANLTNVTVSNLHSSAADIVNGIAFSMFDGVEQSMNANIKNTTVNNIENTSTAYGIAAVGVSESGNSTAVVNIQNTTIDHIRGSAGPYGGVAGVAAGGVAMTPSFSTTVNVNLQNVLLSDALLGDAGQNCNAIDLTPGFSGTGTPSLNITSGGGNLSSDSSCSPYFTQSTDQNNVSNLTSTLGTLTNNGGYIPTIALLQGSPAIDAGVNIVGLTTDARLVSRPQGAAFDSGAYESSYTTTASLADTGENQRGILILVSTLFTIGLILAFARHSSVSKLQ